MQKNKLRDMPVRPLLYTMAVPLMFSLLIQSLYNIVDSIFVAKLSETALTAASLVYAIQFLMIAIGVGTAVGLNALLSQKLGQKKHEEACRVATTGLFLMIATSVVFSLSGVFFSKQIAMFLSKDIELQQLCNEYVSINLIFCYGIFLQTYGQRLLQAVGDTLLSMFSLIIGAIVNIILDPIMIFGLFGCEAMGIRGAAIGSFMTFALNSILLSVSSTAVAFFGIYYKLQNFLMMPVNGLGQSEIPVVGYNYGSGQMDRVKQAWKVLIPTGIVFALCGTLVFMLFPSQLLKMFSASEEMMVFGIPALRIISVTFVFSVITILCGYFASGLGNGVINMIGGALRQLIVLVPVIYVLIQYAGINKVWFAFWISEGIGCLYSLLAVKREKQKKNITM